MIESRPALTEAMRARGIRLTSQRRLVAELLESADRHLDAEGVLELARRRDPTIHRATVYRTLGHLQDSGILKQVFFDNKQSYYEVIAGRETHDYLICIETGKVIEFDSERLRSLRDEICRQHGFDPISHRFQIFGVSPEAAQKKTPNA